MQSFIEWIGYEFSRTFIRDSRWSIFVMGLKNTLIITIAATLIGIAIGTVVAVVHNFAADEDIIRQKKHFRLCALPLMTN